MDNENDIREVIETHFSNGLCLSVKQALKYKFPDIKNLSVDMDEHGTVHIIFDETEHT